MNREEAYTIRQEPRQDRREPQPGEVQVDLDMDSGDDESYVCDYCNFEAANLTLFEAHCPRCVGRWTHDHHGKRGYRPEFKPEDVDGDVDQHSTVHCASAWVHPSPISKYS